MGLALALILQGGAIAAPPCDIDNDGYDSDAVGCQGPPGFEGVIDCDDADPAVHPGAAEVYRDGLDQDCDGADRVRYRLVEGFEDLQDWDRSGNAPGSGQVFTNGDVLIMDSHAGGGGAQGDSWVSLRSPLQWPRGEPWAVLHLPMMTDATCTLSASALDEVSQTFTTPGMHQVDLSGLGAPPFTLDELEIRCSGPGSSVVDFVTLGNAAYVWPPLDDLGSIQGPIAGWVDTNTPVGGATNNVLEVSNGTLFAVSDVGAGAWTTDGENWSLLNDLADEYTTPQHLWPTEDLAIWDLGVYDDGTLWALTGDKDAREQVGSGLRPTRGSLFTSSDTGATWTRVLGAEDGVASYGRNWDCNASSGGVVARAGGELMAILSYPTAGSFSRQVLLVATDVPELSDPDPVLAQGRGVRLVDEDLDTCMLPLPATAVAPVSALALGEGSVAGEATLLVGLKAATGEPGLVRCSVPDGLGLPLDCDDLSTVTCSAVTGSEGFDVRDLEVDPDDPLRAYVADGGRDRGGSEECLFGEPGVATWDRSWDGASWSDVLTALPTPFPTAPTASTTPTPRSAGSTSSPAWIAPPAGRTRTTGWTTRWGVHATHRRSPSTACSTRSTSRPSTACTPPATTAWWCRTASVSGTWTSGSRTRGLTSTRTWPGCTPCPTTTS